MNNREFLDYMMEYCQGKTGSEIEKEALYIMWKDDLELRLHDKRFTLYDPECMEEISHSHF